MSFVPEELVAIKKTTASDGLQMFKRRPACTAAITDGHFSVACWHGICLDIELDSCS